MILWIAVDSKLFTISFCTFLWIKRLLHDVFYVLWIECSLR